MQVANGFDRHILDINCAYEVNRIVTYLRDTVHGKFRKKGAILGISGGIDSSVVAALANQAFGDKKVLGLYMPEHDTDDSTLHYVQLIKETLNMELYTENISEVLRSLHCYKRRNEAIRNIIPQFEDDWKCKIILPKTHETGQMNFFSIVAMSPDGTIITKRLKLSSYLTIVAASNFKQRTRKMIEYYHAERLNYAVLGTPNQLEYDQGFFVKNGDGAADVKPIAHLYKTQVYQLAEYLGIPKEIRDRPPTTDTYSLAQSQDEFYFSLPYDKMDLCLYGMDNKVPADEVARVIDIPSEQVSNVFKDIQKKRKLAKYLHAGAEVLTSLQ